MIVNRGTWDEISNMCRRCSHLACWDLDMGGKHKYSCRVQPPDVGLTCSKFQAVHTCADCRHSYQLKRINRFSASEDSLDGFICMSCRHEDVALWMVGVDINTEGCEEWEEKKIGVNRSYACARQEKAVRSVEVVDDAGYTEGTGQLGAK